MAFRIILILFICTLLKFPVFAQVDTEFWFAAPEVTTLHADRPIFLRIATLQKGANIKISQPANPSFTTLTQNLSANSAISIDLTSLIDIIENKPADKVLNYGILVESSNPITAYYEVLGSSSWSIGVNSDIFVLKGKHALGNEFYVPFQTHWDNNTSVNGWSSFDIVATENNTTVSITPTQDIFGFPSAHLSGVTYTVTLQKGETYSAQSASALGINHPTGSHITSTKPIAVTTKDDSILESGSYDLAGDQIIPITNIGKEYIAIKVSDTFNSDRLYIVATKNNTDIFLDGNTLPSATLNAGQAFEYQILSPTTYITTSDSVYLWHVAGFSTELGGAIIPPLGCTGSRQVSFTRSTDELFYLNIVVKSGYEQYFKLNGKNNLVPASSFTTVPGSLGAWKYAHIPFDYLVIPSSSANLIKNDSADFQLATLNGTATTGFRYGYFSDFGFLELGSNESICEGDSIRFDAGFGRDSYLWNTGATGQYITVKDTGFYNVTITKGSCMNSDTVHLEFYPKITTPVLGNDTAACAENNLSIKTLSSFYSYKWNTGEKGRSIIPKHTGDYKILVKNKYGCEKRDTIHVELYPTPKPEIIFETDLKAFCENPYVHLRSNKNFTSYKWSTGDTIKSVVTMHNEKDYYTLSVTDNMGCKGKTDVTIDCSPVIGLIPNLLTPNDDGKNDIFYIEYLRTGTWIFEIYNGWGERIYKNDGYDNSFEGKVLDDGVYYYSLRHKEGKGEYKGWLEVIRSEEK